MNTLQFLNSASITGSTKPDLGAFLVGRMGESKNAILEDQDASMDQVDSFEETLRRSQNTSPVSQTRKKEDNHSKTETTSGDTKKNAENVDVSKKDRVESKKRRADDEDSENYSGDHEEDSESDKDQKTSADSQQGIHATETQSNSVTVLQQVTAVMISKTETSEGGTEAGENQDVQSTQEVVGGGSQAKKGENFSGAMEKTTAQVGDDSKVVLNSEDKSSSNMVQENPILKDAKDQLPVSFEHKNSEAQLLKSKVNTENFVETKVIPMVSQSEAGLVAQESKEELVGKSDVQTIQSTLPAKQVAFTMSRENASQDSANGNWVPDSFRGLLSQTGVGIKGARQSDVNQDFLNVTRKEMGAEGFMSYGGTSSSGISKGMGAVSETQTLMVSRPADMVKAVEQVQKILETSSSKEPKFVVIQLDPPNLGKIEIQMTRDSHGWNVKWAVSRPEVQEWLSQQLPGIQSQSKGQEVPIFWSAPTLQSSTEQYQQGRSQHGAETQTPTWLAGEGEDENVSKPQGSEFRRGYWA